MVEVYRKMRSIKKVENYWVNVSLCSFYNGMFGVGGEMDYYLVKL